MQRIESGAFLSSRLSELVIPNSVTYIGYWAFGYFDGLTSLTMPYVLDRELALLFNDGSVPSGPSSIVITGGAALPSYAFYGWSNLKYISLPEEGLLAVGTYAFYGCTGLRSLVIPASVTGIGSRAFEGCTALEELTLPLSGSSAVDGYTQADSPYFSSLRTR